jgi:hypothetical protein
LRILSNINIIIINNLFYYNEREGKLKEKKPTLKKKKRMKPLPEKSREKRLARVRATAVVEAVQFGKPGLKGYEV